MGGEAGAREDSMPPRRLKGEVQGDLEGSWAPAAPSGGASPTFSHTATRKTTLHDLKLVSSVVKG